MEKDDNKELMECIGGGAVIYVLSCKKFKIALKKIMQGKNLL